MTMTLDELRDAHAKRLGWKGYGENWWRHESSPPGDSKSYFTHPIPATLDAIAGLMPPNWEWCMDVDVLEAYRDTTGYVWVERTGDELTDRARLAWLAWEAEAKGAK
jgi:hypothetical protein